MQIKALALCSGGLDSALTTAIVLDQGVQVEALYFINVFLPGYKGRDQEDFCRLQKRQAEQLGIRLHIFDNSQALLELVCKPCYGYGENMNPCIDCRILMLKEAKAYMQSRGFSFLISGEVLGQRPMSQRKDALNIIDRDAQVKGLVLRPLSAKLLKPTVAEERGWVNRDKLFDFSGRSRKPQLALAEKLGVKEYLTPAGGCLLTDIEFARKFKDLSASGAFDLDDIQLLKLGRHFRYRSLTKIVVGRDEEENRCLMDLARDEDLLLKLRDFAGPLTLAQPVRKSFSNGAGTDRNEQTASMIEMAARLTTRYARYSKGKDKEKVWVEYWPKNSRSKRSILVSAAGEDLIKQLKI